MKAKSNTVLIFVTLIILVLASSSLLSAGWRKISAQSDPQFHREITVAAGETQKNILAFKSRVQVDGRVEENVVVFGGEIIINGEVGQSVVGFGTRVIIKSSAVVNEDVVVLGGTLEKEPGCVVKGDTVFFPTGRKLTGEIFKKGVFFPLGTIFLAFKLISLFFGLLLIIFVAGLFPRQVNLAASRIQNDFWPVLGIGFLSQILFFGLVALSALLMFILIGIPLFFILLSLGMIIKIFGGTAFSYFLGQSFLRALGVQKMPHIIWTSIIGLVLATFFSLLPMVGFLFSLVIGFVGWGVAIRTRFGTTENWFKHQS
ncbi:MAG: hypothetical protein H5U07_02055 [Candidatus Aminicenantes bacterium]|nr:hypothetical protein [Candidatus Aminicenantes bacterium]